MHEFETVDQGFLVATTVDGLLHCHMGYCLGGRLDLARAVATIHRRSIEARAFGVLVHLTGETARAELAPVRDAVMASAIPAAEFRPWAWVVPQGFLNEWSALGQRLSLQGLVTGIFTEPELALAAAYLRRHGPLWMAGRRWLFATAPQAGARGPSQRMPSGVPPQT